MDRLIKNIDESADWFDFITLSQEDVWILLNLIERQQRIIQSFENKEMVVGEKFYG